MAALFAANALNVFILYVPLEEMPESIRWLLPWIKVVCGVAAALSLDGTLISVTMGRRLGRTSAWSWATIVATGVFTAAVAWYVHHAVGAAAAVLFMAQAVILVLYGQHLAQPRKALHLVSTHENHDATAPGSARPALPLNQSKSHDNVTATARLRKCSKCGAERLWSLTDIRAHQQTDDCQRPV